MGFLAGSKQEVKQHYSLVCTNKRLTRRVYLYCWFTVYPLMLNTALAQQVAAYGCPASALLPFLTGQDTFSLSWQKSPHSPVWECKGHGFSPATGVRCPCPHLKTFPWNLLKQLDNMRVMPCEVKYPCFLFRGARMCHLWSCLLSTESSRQGQHPCSMAACCLIQKDPGSSQQPPDTSTNAGTDHTGICFDVPAPSPPVPRYIKVNL